MLRDVQWLLKWFYYSNIERSQTVNTSVLVQILGTITLIISIIALQQRKKENFLSLYIISNSVFALQYFLTNKITGAIIVIIVIIRGFVFLY